MTTATNVMVDIETLDNTSTSLILSIGACVFDENGVGTGHFYTTVNAASCHKIGLTVSNDTVSWWLRQSEPARNAVFGENHMDLLQAVVSGTMSVDAALEALTPGGMQIADALEELRQWWPTGATFWGNGATFDNVIVSDAYRRLGARRPWHYTADRCYRTLKALYPQVKATSRAGTYHNALDDALYQADHAAKILAYMKGLQNAQLA